MQNSISVILHYFIGVGAFFAFILALLFPKGSLSHRIAGSVAVGLYFLVMLSGLLAGVRHHFYKDNTLKMMLWMQTFFAFTLIVQGISAQRNKGELTKIKLLNLQLATAAFVFAICTAVVGGLVSQSISCLLGIMVALFTAKNFVVFYLGTPTKNSWIYFHSSAMITSGALLLLNGTGFFGVHDVLDLEGVVSWSRVLKSIAPFFIFVEMIDYWLYKKYFAFSK